MPNDIFLHVAIAKQFLHHANFAGNARQGIADAFSSVDAMFSALLRTKGIKIPRNHKQKLDLVRKTIPSVFSARTERYGTGVAYSPGVCWKRLESFYVEWLASRYEEFNISSDELVERINEARTVLFSGMRHIATELKIDHESIDKKTSEIAFGYAVSAVNSRVAHAHEKLFGRAELYGEMHGCRLGTKLAATTNFCDLDFVAGDALTQSIIETDVELASEAAEIYVKYNTLVEKIIERRRAFLRKSIVAEDSEEKALDLSTDFLLALKFRYHGASVGEQGRRFRKSFAQAFQRMVGRINSEDQDSEAKP